MTDTSHNRTGKILATAACAFAALAGVLWLAAAPPDRTARAADPAPQEKKGDGKDKSSQPDIRKLTPVQVFMRAKLEDNTKILEGLMTDRMDQIVDAAEHLNLMSTATEWHVIQGPIYKQHSTEFRRAVEHLKTEAEKKNLDAATLAYMHMTMTCINCHKFVRGTQLASNSELPTNSLVFSAPDRRQSP